MSAPCPRCKCPDARIRYDFGRKQIVRCSACRLLYLDPWPTPEETAAVYGEDYFQNAALLEGDSQAIFGYADYIAERTNKQKQYAAIARELRGLLVPEDPTRRPRLLEVGCGYGYFLDEAFENGFEPTGLEFNRFAVERLRRKYAFPILSGALEEGQLPEAAFDAVVMFDVIEHLRDPFQALASLHRALRPGGILVVSTPDAESLVSRLLGSRLEDFRRTREHLFFFGRRTLHETLYEQGYDPLETRSIGHTFELAFLLNRLALYNRPLFTKLRRLVVSLGLGGLDLEVNPHTKMIVFARRREQPRRARLTDGLLDASLPDVDRTLVEELDKLETVTNRHYRWVADVVSPWLGRRVLEVGSGIGVVSKWLLPRCDFLILSDHHPVYLRLLRERFGSLPHVRYQMLDLEQRPYRIEAAVDTIVCLNVLEHLRDDETILRALADLLPAGGRLILQVPNLPSLYGSLDEAYGHVQRYSPGILRERLQAAGFRVTALRRFNPLSIPGWIVSGRILRRRAIDPGMLRAYDALVPLQRRLDFLSRVTGISLLACAERR